MDSVYLKRFSIRAVFFGFLCLCPFMGWTNSDNPSSFFSFLPKNEALKAAKLLSELDTQRSSRIEGQRSILEAERIYAQSSRVLSSLLDEYGNDPTLFIKAAAFAGKQGFHTDSARKELSVQRRLRWESARDYAESHTRVFGGKEPQPGLGLVFLIEPYVSRTTKKALQPLADGLERRFAQDPACPRGAFDALAAIAETFELKEYRTWILHLASFDPAAFISDLPAGMDAAAPQDATAQQAAATPKDAGTPLDAAGTPQAAGTPLDAAGPLGIADPYTRALQSYSLHYRSLQALAGAFPAAAVAAWYVDAYGAGSPLPSAALASFSHFIASLGSMEPVALGNLLAEHPVLASAFSETISVAWIAQSLGNSFSEDLGLEPHAVTKALDRAWDISTRLGLGEPIPASDAVLDRQTVYAAENVARSLESGKSDAEFFASLRSAGEKVLRALSLGARYGGLRDRYDRTIRDVLGALEQNIRLKAPASIFLDGESEYAPTLASVSFVPFGIIYAACELEFDYYGNGGIRVPFSIEQLDRSLPMIQAPNDAIRFTLPGIVRSGILTGPEQSFISPSQARELPLEVFSVACGRYGLPLGFALIGSASIPTDHRYALISASAFRLSRSAGHAGGPTDGPPNGL